MSKKLIECWERAQEEVSAAHERTRQLMKTEYPVGSLIRWNKWGGDHHGRVVLHGYYDRLKVENLATGKEYWITIYDVAQAA